MTTYFTKEQIQQARKADLFDYLQANEPGVLKKDGRNYRHREHDSLVYVTAKKLLVLEQPRQEHYRSGLSDGDQRLQIQRSGFPSDWRRANESFTASRIFSK